MTNAAQAYLQTEGTISYRECKLLYYTYSMIEQPKMYKINVNVLLHDARNDFIKTLPLDDAFDKEEAAIDYGIAAGKKYIDQAYSQGKIKVTTTVNPIQTKNPKAEKPKPYKPAYKPKGDKS